MDRSRFFAALRSRDSGLFGTSLTKGQVQGMEALLDSCIRNGVTDTHHAAHVLAQVYKETGGHMLGIKETVMPQHKDKNPSDATVIARLEKAWKAGKLPWVSTPYWRDGAFGRGPIQLTHWKNYEKFASRLGVPLRQKPELALDPVIGADIAVIGMSEGLFTGRKLSDYSFPAALNAKPDNHPRRIVNGKDGTDKTVAGYHRAFHAALTSAGWAGKSAQKPADAQKPVPAPNQPATPKPAPAATPGGKAGIFAVLLAGIATLLAATWEWIINAPCNLLGLFCGG